MMKALLILLLCNCLLVPFTSGQASAQSFVQLREKFAQSRQHSQDGSDRGQNQRGLNERGLGDRGQSDRGQNDRIPTRFAAHDDNEQSGIDRREASDRARSAYPGRVVNIRRDGDTWRVRMEKGGTVFNVSVDADNGSVLRSSD